MKKKNGKNSALFSSRSHLPFSFSIAKWSQSTFCPRHHSDHGDTLLVTTVSSAESRHRWVSPRCDFQQRHHHCKRIFLWDAGPAWRLLPRTGGRIWCISLQIFELVGKTHRTGRLMSIGTPQKRNYKNVKTVEVTHILK